MGNLQQKGLADHTGNWRLYVIGAGPIGLTVAALLQARYTTSLICRADKKKLLQGGTLTLSGAIEQQDALADVSILSIDDLQPAQPSSAFFLAIQAHQLRATLAQIRPHLTEKTPVFLMSNGLGILLEASEVLRREALLFRLICYFGARWNDSNDPFHIRVSGKPKFSLTALRDDRPRFERWLDELSGIPNFDMFTERDVATAEWNKACTNIVVNGIATLAQAPNGIILESQELLTLAEQLHHEVASIAAAEGFLFPPDHFRELLSGVKAYALNINSTLASIRSSRQTEIEYIFGRALRIASSYGVKVPRLESIYALLKALETSSLQKRQPLNRPS